MKKIIMVVLVLGSLLLMGCSKSVDTEPLAKCLTANKAVMYGTSWCSYCQKQKTVFGSSFSKVTYVDCDKEKLKCVAAGVKGYPTWIINGQSYPGFQPLDKLAVLAGCKK